MHVVAQHTPIIRRIRVAFRRFARSEGGAAYTLSYVMVVPFYALLICLIIETCMMMTAKLGTVYAAYAAVRSASVWSSHTTWDKAKKKAEKAAFQAMAPFASGTQPKPFGIPPIPTLDSGAFVGAYEVFADEKVSATYLLAKYEYATRHVWVKIDGPPASSTTNLTAKVTYDFPFNVPGIGMLLGTKVGGRYYFRITSEATMPSEVPQNEGNKTTTNSIGIGYGQLE
jgi:Flp pilus assembly protein TadG